MGAAECVLGTEAMSARTKQELLDAVKSCVEHMPAGRTRTSTSQGPTPVASESGAPWRVRTGSPNEDRSHQYSSSTSSSLAKLSRVRGLQGLQGGRGQPQLWPRQLSNATVALPIGLLSASSKPDEARPSSALSMSPRHPAGEVL